MEQVREEDGECAEVEGGVEVFVFFENEGGGEDAVDGLEVEREVHAVGGEGAEEMDVIGVSKDGADPGKEEDPEPIELGRREQSGKSSEIEQWQGGEADNGGAEHFPTDHGERISTPGHNGAIEDRENSREQRSKERDSESEQMPPFHTRNQDDPRNDDEAQKYLEGLNTTAGEKWFSESGEERDGRESGQADGNIGELDGAEEAQPVQSDDHAYPDQHRRLLCARPDFVFPNKRHPEECAKRSQNRLP